MKVDYDSDGIKSVLTEILEEFGFKKQSDTPDSSEDYDVGEEDYTTGRIAPYSVEGSDPIGVAIVAEKPVVVVQRGSLTWGSQATVIGSAPQIIVGRDKRRRTFIIKNMGVNAIAIDAHPNVKFGSDGLGNGYGSGQLAGGDSITLDVTGEVWAVASSASTGETVSIFQVFDDGQ